MAYQSPLLEVDHPQTTYLKKDEIGLILSKALAETYQAQPSKPIEFFSKFLLNYSKRQKKASQEQEREKQVKDLRDKNKYFIKAKQAEQEEIAKEEKAQQDKIAKFYELLDKSDDLTDNLDELADFLKEFTNSTGVYVGKLIKPLRPIKDDDDDKAHIDDEKPKVVQFLYTSKGHEFLKDKILQPDQGVTHQVFTLPIPKEEIPAENEGEEQEVVKVVDPSANDILKTQHHVYIKEVVREPKMHFYKVPRLGSFMAIPLVFKSCLFEDALDHAVSDYFAVLKAREDQEKAKQDFEDEQHRLKDEKERLGETFEAPDPKAWEPIQEKPFEIEIEEWVICIDTLGQDRELSEKERRLALETVQNFKKIWEQTEVENLTRDRNRKIEIMEIDKEFLDTEASKLIEEEDKNIEEALTQRQEPFDDELKDLYQKQARLAFVGRQFRDRADWRRNIDHIKEFKVLKLPRVLQSIMYFLHYKREEICEKGTGKFFWKKAKNYIDHSFFERICQFQPLGAKDQYQERYSTINFVERNIEGINPEDVDSYNLTLGKLYRWFLLALKTRKEDITRRKALQRKAREHRELLIEQSKQREIQHAKDMTDAEVKFLEDKKEEIEAFQKWEAERAIGQGTIESAENNEGNEEANAYPQMPVFNKDEWEVQWHLDNPEIVIPEPIIEDKDNDWYMNREEEDLLIQQYFQHRGETH